MLSSFDTIVQLYLVSSCTCAINYHSVSCWVTMLEWSARFFHFRESGLQDLAKGLKVLNIKFSVVRGRVTWWTVCLSIALSMVSDFSHDKSGFQDGLWKEARPTSKTKKGLQGIQEKVKAAQKSSFKQGE